MSNSRRDFRFECPSCGHRGLDRGRAFDGRRAYRCKRCGKQWTCGLQGRTKQYKQTVGMQFYDTGVVK